MSYLATGSLTEAQESALSVDPDKLRALRPEARVNLLLRHQELRAQEREAFWNALQAFATAAIPIAAFFGITTLFGGKR